VDLGASGRSCERPGVVRPRAEGASAAAISQHRNIVPNTQKREREGRGRHTLAQDHQHDPWGRPGGAQPAVQDRCDARGGHMHPPIAHRQKHTPSRGQDHSNEHHRHRGRANLHVGWSRGSGWLGSRRQRVCTSARGAGRGHLPRNDTMRCICRWGAWGQPRGAGAPPAQFQGCGTLLGTPPAPPDAGGAASGTGRGRRACVSTVRSHCPNQI
jgi:hypothetical protein